MGLNGCGIRQDRNFYLQCATTSSSKFFFNSHSWVGNLAGWDLAPRSPLPLFHFLIYLSPWTQDFALVHFLVLPFPSNCILSAQLAPFHYISSLELINYTAESILGCFEISSANRINPNLFTLASGRLFRQGQRTATFFTKISQEQYLGNILKFFPWNLLSQAPTVQNFHSSTSIAYYMVLKAVHAFLTQSTKVQTNSSKQKHDQACHSNTPGTNNFCLS